MKKFLRALLLLTLVPALCLADETLTSGLTLTIPSQGATNWGTSFKNNFAQKISEHDHTGSGKGLQITTNAIASSAISGAKIRLANDEYLRARNAANSGDINILKVNTADQIQFNLTPANVPPAGSILMYGGASAPTGYVLCDGSAISRSTYAALFAVLSTTYGVGDGSTTFNVPDLRQRFPLGKAASGTGNTLGGTGGNIDHTHIIRGHYHGMGTGADLNITSSGSHLHTVDHDHASATSGAGTAHTHSINHDHASANTSSDGAHQHFIINNDLNNAAVSASNYIARSYNASNDFSYEAKGSNTVADRGLTSSSGAHTHSLDLPNFTGTSGSESSHTHDIDLPNFTGNSGSSSHTHTSGSFAGKIGLVTGGFDGNADTSTTGGNPPYVVVNYIIKY